MLHCCLWQNEFTMASKSRATNATIRAHAMKTINDETVWIVMGSYEVRKHASSSLKSVHWALNLWISPDCFMLCRLWKKYIKLWLLLTRSFFTMISSITDSWRDFYMSNSFGHTSSPRQALRMMELFWNCNGAFSLPEWLTLCLVTKR